MPSPPVRDRAIAYWERASPREQALLALGAVLVVLGLGWPLVWQPLERDLQRIDDARRDARVRIADARKAADEIAGLARVAKLPATSDPRAAVERVVASRALRGAVTAFDAEGGRVRLTFAAIELNALVLLLDALAREEHLFVSEALLAARVEPGSVRAELTLTRAASR